MLNPLALALVPLPRASNSAPPRVHPGARLGSLARDFPCGRAHVLADNKAGASNIPTGPCSSWAKTDGGYYEGANVGHEFTNLTLAEAEAACCSNDLCAGFSFSKTGNGYYKGAPLTAETKARKYDGCGCFGAQCPAMRCGHRTKQPPPA